MLGLQEIRGPVWRPHAGSAAASSLVPLGDWIANDVALLKDGRLLMLGSLRGVEREGLDEEDVEALSRTYSSALRSLGYEVECAQYRMKHCGPEGGWEIRDNVALTMRPPATARSFWNRMRSGLRGAGERLSEARTMRRFEAALDDRISQLRSAAEGFAALLAPSVEVRFLDRDEALLAWWRLANLDVSQLDEMADLLPLPADKFLASVPIAVYGRHLQIGKNHVEILHLREPPPETHVDILWELASEGCSFTLAVNVAGVEQVEMARLLDRRRTEYHLKRWSLIGSLVAGKNASLSEVRQDLSAEALQADIGALKSELVANATPVLRLSLFLSLFSEDPRQVEQASARCRRIFSKHGAQLLPESWGLVPARFASLPGGWVYDLRQLYMTLPNCVDLSLGFHPARE